MDPAIVRGNESVAVALFIEDGRGDLVDILYVCEDDPRAVGALHWPAFDFGDSDAYCQTCGHLVNVARRMQ